MIPDSAKKDLKKALLFHAKGLNLPEGAAEDFIKKSIAAAEKSFTKKSAITDQDLKRAVAKSLKKYHPDLAYVYENYDKII